MITKTLKISLFVFALASFSFASAQQKSEITVDKSERMFKHLDANSDNKISLEEYKAKFSKKMDEGEAEIRYKKMDTDKNGFLDRAEVKAAMSRSGMKKSKTQAKEVKLKKG